MLQTLHGTGGFLSDSQPGMGAQGSVAPHHRMEEGEEMVHRHDLAPSKKCGVKNPLVVSLSQVQCHYHAVDCQYQDLKKKTPEFRQEYLRDRPKNKSGKVTASQQQAAKHILCMELQCLDTQHLKAATGKTQGGVISHIEVKEGEVYMEKTTQEEVEEHMMAMCKQHFCLTKSTPPVQEPLQSELGLLGEMEAAQQIIKGMCDCPEGVDKYTRSFIEMLKACAPSSQVNILMVFTKEDFQSFWKKCNKHTSSSISGLHYSHYKAVADNDHLSKLQQTPCHRNACHCQSWPLPCLLAKRTVVQAGESHGGHSSGQALGNPATNGN